MKTTKNWLATPITWGGYLKLCGIAWLITAIYTVVFWVKTGLLDLSAIVDKMKFWNTEDEED